jgi:hypothetical protein
VRIGAWERHPGRRESWFRRLWRRLTGRPDLPPPFDRPDDDPALVPTGPPRGRPSLSAEAELPEPYEFDDHADHPRTTEA